MHRPVDSLSLRWDNGPAASPVTPVSVSTRAVRVNENGAAGGGGGSISGSQTVHGRQSARMDPSSMPAAGSRSSSYTHTFNGGSYSNDGSLSARTTRASVRPAFESNPNRENAKDAIFQAPPAKAPTTPVRAVGGGTSMDGIFSVSASVPRTLTQSPQSPSRPSMGKAHIGPMGASQIQFGTSGNDPSSPVSSTPRTGRATVDGKRSTTSNVTFGSEIDRTPVHTGKAINRARANKTNWHMSHDVSSLNDGSQSARVRPQTAASSYKNRSTLTPSNFGSVTSPSPSTSSTENGGASNGSQTARARPQTARGARSSDIFFRLSSTATESSARKTGRAHFPNRQSQQSESMKPRPSRALGSARRPVDTLNLSSFPSSSPSSSSSSESKTPSYRPDSARAARNASSLFDSSSQVAELQPKSRPPQIPDMPERIRKHAEAVASRPKKPGVI